MFVKYKGLLRETLPSGNTRIRVRMKGNKTKKTTLPVDIDHPEFSLYYNAARLGQPLQTRQHLIDHSREGSLAELTLKYLDYLEKQTQLGHASPKTFHKKRRLLENLMKEHGEKSFIIPRKKLIAIRDNLSHTPSQADALIITLSMGTLKPRRQRFTLKAWSVQD